MPPPSPRQTKVQGLARRPAGEHELKLAEDQVPVLAAGTPVSGDPLGGQIEHPAQGIVISEAGLVLGDLTELAVEALDNIRRVYDFPDLGWVFIEGAQNIPVILPALHAGGILLPPFLPKPEQVFLRLVQGRCRLSSGPLPPA